MTDQPNPTAAAELAAKDVRSTIAHSITCGFSPTVRDLALAIDEKTGLPLLIALARMALVPERDAYDQYDGWHDRLKSEAITALAAAGCGNEVAATTA